MKKFQIISLFLVFVTVSLNAQTYSVTFQVDMSYETVSENGVHVAGTFQEAAGYPSNWDPSSTELTDDDLDNIYELSVTIPSGTYLYKFINGTDWINAEDPDAYCAFDDGNGNMNRQFTLGESNLKLPVVLFDSCNVVMNLAINMESEIVSPDGLHVFGDFQTAAGFDFDWDPVSIPLQDVNDDGVYEVHIQVPPGNYQYLFVNGNSAEDAEEINGDCVIDDGNGTMVRLYNASTGASSPSVYCYESCDICDPNINPVYDTYWWNDAVFYEIFVRSFYDSDNDGIGDFQGIIEKLDYLNDGDPETHNDLGITGIWLMPVMESPSYHGYDASDYYTVEPDYGTMADFEEFLDEAHARGIKVILDFVMNHCSNQHPWFTQSANDQNEFRDWFIWEDTNPGFTGPWGQQVWHYNNGAYYYGIFWSGMPDLNYSHEPVKNEMFDVADFWLEKGVDGFRLDAIKYLDEDGETLENTPETFQLLEEFRSSFSDTNPDAFTVGEVWSATSSVIPYVENERLHTCFDFDLAYGIINSVNGTSPAAIRNQMNIIQNSYPRLQYSTFLTNHDIDRIFSQFDSDESKMKQAALLYLTLPGVPFVYYGEEIGMTGTGAHENIRRPMQWTGGTNAGFSGVSPWYGIGDNYLTNNVEIFQDDESSLLNHYKKLIHLRNDQDALQKGYYLEIDNIDNSLLSYARLFEQEAVLVLSNFADENTSIQLNLNASGLSAGEYFVTELYSNSDFGTITINSNGGFSEFTPQVSILEPEESLILLISQSQSVEIHKDISKDLKVKLYPNPSHGFSSIVFNKYPSSKSTIKISNLNGRTLDQFQFRGKKCFINTESYSAGIYFVEIQNEDLSSVFKMIIQ